MDAALAALPSQSTVAVVTMRGSLCPVTLGHVRCFEEARGLFLGGTTPAGGYDYCCGFMSLNGDSHLRGKFAGKTDRLARPITPASHTCTNTHTRTDTHTHTTTTTTTVPPPGHPGPGHYMWHARTPPPPPPPPPGHPQALCGTHMCAHVYTRRPN